MKLKKITKKTFKFVDELSDDFFEEAEDFFKDFFKKNRLHKRLKTMKFYGATIAVRPAYVFAERVENILKLVFGISILMSGLLATFWGFTRTSELLRALIGSGIGRIVIVVIGFSYFVIGVWKVLNLHK